MDFTNKVALVTGGTRGIGKAIAEGIISRGGSVIYTGTKGRVNMGSPLSYIPLDLSKDKSISAFVQHLKKFKRIDILVNNAGINIIEPIDKVKRAHWEKIIKVNLTGSMLVLNKVAQIMKKNKKGGKVLNVSSIFGLKSRSMRNSYSASKSGLIGLTRASALDLAKYNILVNALCPGFTATDLTSAILKGKAKKKICEEIPLGRFASVDEIANVAIFLCSDLNTYITGETVAVDGGVMIR